MTVQVGSTPGVAEIRPLVTPVVRLGYAAKGTVYLLTGALAFGLATGVGGRITDASGVLHAVLQRPFGWIALTVLGVGLIAYGVWQGVMALPGPTRPHQRSKHWVDRALSVIRGIVYGSIGWEAMPKLAVTRRSSLGTVRVAIRSRTSSARSAAPWASVLGNSRRNSSPP